MTPNTRHLPQDSVPVFDAGSIAQGILTAYGFLPIEITPLGGYTNRNFLLTDKDDNRFVLRIPRSRRSSTSQESERHVLAGLEADGYSLVPRIYPPSNPQPDHWQLSYWLPGVIEGLWWQQCSPGKVAQIFTELARLHDRMDCIPALNNPAAKKQAIPADTQTPSITAIADATERAPILPTAPSPALQSTPVGRYVADSWPVFLRQVQRIEADMEQEFQLSKAAKQWIHGDIQLENLLFENERFSGFLDFERVRWDARIKDIIFSAFRVCREGATDEPFRYDPQRFALAIGSYRKAAPDLPAPFFRDYDSRWKSIFCLDQAMVYLENAFDGTWQLVEGIGFLPCYNEVLNYRCAE